MMDLAKELTKAEKLILGVLRSQIMYYNPRDIVANDNGAVLQDPSILLADYVDDQGMPIVSTGATLEEALVNLSKEVMAYLNREGAPVLLGRPQRRFGADGQAQTHQRVVRMRDGVLMMGTHEVPRESKIVKFKAKA
ncbi:MAG: hypothetical protein GC136_00705 [Alphaproteobacteria bacterium]|nr:hypothetical protein [Alphaproteobacteria bacterium]